MVVQGMTKICGRIVIGIGSSDKSRTVEDPFTFEERKEMIQNALQAEDIIPMFDVELVALPDHENDASWAEQVLERVGRVDKVWTGNEWTMNCFDGKAEIQWIKEVPGFSGTEIRALIKNNGDWEEKVPEEVYGYILSLNNK